jgi:hypothetical protein
MRVLAALILMSAMLVAGCAAKPQAAGGGSARTGRAPAATNPTATPKTSAASSARNVDPCAMRLHDLCAPLLLYFARYQSLPAKPDDLAQISGFDVPAITCPVTSKAYLYNPHGPSGPDPGSRIILYDAAPHDGRRWGIAVTEPAPGQALVAKVIVVPESIFTRPASGQ